MYEIPGLVPYVHRSIRYRSCEVGHAEARLKTKANIQTEVLSIIQVFKHLLVHITDSK